MIPKHASAASTFIRKSGLKCAAIALTLLTIVACADSQQRPHIEQQSIKKHPLHIIMIGAPSVGKGTHASIIAQKYDIPHISTGDILRNEVKSKSKLGQEIDKIMQQGGLVPPSITMELLDKRLNQADCRNGYILDGAPRSEYQAEIISKKLKERTNSINVVLNLATSDEELINRVAVRAKCGKCNAGLIQDASCKNCRGDEVVRADDNVETFKQRLRTHHRHSRAVLSYFKHHSDFVIINIDASGQIDDVSKNMLMSIDHFVQYSIKNPK